MSVSKDKRQLGLRGHLGAGDRGHGGGKDVPVFVFHTDEATHFVYVL